MLTYDEFKEEVIERLNSYYKDLSVVVTEKPIPAANQINATALVIQFPGQIMNPAFQLKNYYHENCTKDNIDEIVERIIENINNNDAGKKSCIELDSKLHEPEWIKANVRIKLVNFDRNIDLLKEIVHEKYLNLAKVPYVSSSFVDFNNKNRIAHVTFPDKLLEENSITRDEIISWAEYNTLSDKPVALDLIRYMTEGDADAATKSFEVDLNARRIPDCILIYLKNQPKYGASVVLNTEILRKVSKKMRTKILYISIINEVEIVIVSGNSMPKEDAANMTRMQSFSYKMAGGDNYVSDDMYIYDRRKREEKVYIYTKE